MINFPTSEVVLIQGYGQDYESPELYRTFRIGT